MIKNNFLYALLLLTGILLPLCHSTAQTLPTTTDEPDVTLCQAGQKVVLGNCTDATSFMWSPTTGLTPDSDPKKAQIKVSPTETTAYTRTATRNTPSGVVRETWKVRVVVASSAQIEKFLIDEGFIGFPCTVTQKPAFRDTIQVEERGSSDVVDYANLEVTIERQKMNLKNIISLAAQDILYNVKAVITKKDTYCDGRLMKEYSNFNSGIFIYILEDNSNNKIYVKVKSMNEDELKGFESVVARILRGGLKYSTRYHTSDNAFLAEYVHSGLQNVICVIDKEKKSDFEKLSAVLKTNNQLQTDEGNKELRKLCVCYEESGLDYMAAKKTIDSLTYSYCPCKSSPAGSKYPSFKNYGQYPLTKRSVWYAEHGNIFIKRNDGVYNLETKEGYTNNYFMGVQQKEGMRFHIHPNPLPYTVINDYQLNFKSKDCTGIGIPEYSSTTYYECIGSSSTDRRGYHHAVERPYDVVYEDGYYIFYGESQTPRNIGSPYEVQVPIRTIYNKMKLGLKPKICQ